MPAFILMQRTLLALRGHRGSAAVEYIGLALVVSSLMAAVATAVDSSAGARIAGALVDRLVSAITN
jgi:hypothetical protein